MSSKVDRFEVGEGGVCGVVVRQDPSAASSSSAPATKEVKEAKDKEAEGQDKESEIKDQDAAVTNADGSITLKADFVVMAVGVRPATDYLREAAPSRTSSSESKATEEGAPATASALAAGALESGPKVGIGAESGMPSQASAVASGAAPAASSAPSAASSGSAPSPIPLQPDGSVKVDEYLRVLGSDGGVLGGGSVFGIGDIAQYPDLETGTYRRVEHWNVAGNHGRAVGATIAGKGEPFNKLPVFWSAQGQQLRYCGYGVGFDDVIVKGDVGALKFVAYYVKEGKVVAVSSMQHDPICAKAAQLMRLGKMPGGEAVRGGVDIMKIDISSQGSLV
ncbi:hypothetical protein C8J56DRAFT_142666 [Mycena floridula]|nr:hypothetical protein C8J56DRAFT_142666 [Mycena floridula]